MNRRTSRYFQDKFQGWKNRVRGHIPRLVEIFYGLTDRDEGKERLLGRVIMDINNPMYSFEHDFKRIPQEERLPFEVMLEIHATEIFAHVGYRRNSKQPE